MNTYSFPPKKLQLHRPCRGTMLLEVTVTALLLGALLVVINQAIVRLHRQASLVDKHVAAQQALENLMEELVARPWDSINAAEAESLSLSEESDRRLPAAEWSVEVNEQAEPVISKRVTLRLSWRPSSATKKQEVRLTSWVYRREEATP